MYSGNRLISRAVDIQLTTRTLKFAASEKYSPERISDAVVITLIIQRHPDAVTITTPWIYHENAAAYYIALTRRKQFAAGGVRTKRRI